MLDGIIPLSMINELKDDVGGTIAQKTEEWLEQNIDPATGYVLDNTLTLDNAAPPASAVGDLKSALINVIDVVGIKKSLVPLMVTGGAIKFADGTEYTSYAAIADNYKFSGFIKVEAGMKISYTLRAPTGYCMVAFYSTNDTSGYDATKSVEGTGAAKSGIYDVVADGYIRITTHNTTSGKAATLIKTGEISAEISTLKDEIDISSERVFSLLAVATENGFLTTSGTVTSNANYRTTGFFPIRSGETFQFYIGHATTLPIICFYTERDTASCVTASNVIGVNGYSSGTFTAPSKGYVRFCYYYSSTDSSVVFTANIPDNVKQYVDNNMQTNVLSDIKILCLGDSIFGNDGEVPAYLQEMTGATVINGAVGGTRACNRGGTDDYQYFDGEVLAQALVSGVWTDQETAVAGSLSPWADRLATLEAVNLNNVNLITMDWGTNDYTGEKTIAEIETAYSNIVNLFREHYPAIRLLIITPIWRYFGAKADNENGDNFVYNVSTLKEIASAIDAHAKDLRVESLQMYQKMPLDYNTAELYFDNGSTAHLNATGNQVYAHILSGKIRSMY